MAPEYAQLDERELIRRARSDREAFLALYHRYFPKIYGYLLVRTRDRETAEDLAQETFLRALEALPRYEWRGAPFGAWLFRIAGNALKKTWRDTRESPAETGTLDAAAPPSHPLREIEDQLSDDADLQTVWRALDRLPDRDRALIYLRFISGLSHKEIAAMTQTRPGTVAVTLHRVLSRLRAALAQHQ